MSTYVGFYLRVFESLRRALRGAVCRCAPLRALQLPRQAENRVYVKLKASTTTEVALVFLGQRSGLPELRTLMHGFHGDKVAYHVHWFEGCTMYK